MHRRELGAKEFFSLFNCERTRENGRKKNEGGRRRKGVYVIGLRIFYSFFSLVSLTVSVLLINTQTVPVLWWLVEFFFFTLFHILFYLARALTDGSLIQSNNDSAGEWLFFSNCASYQFIYFIVSILNDNIWPCFELFVSV